MRLIHNLADDFIAARHQAPVLPVERLEADYTVSDDVVPNQIPLCSIWEKPQ